MLKLCDGNVENEFEPLQINSPPCLQLATTLVAFALVDHLTAI